MDKEKKIELLTAAKEHIRTMDRSSARIELDQLIDALSGEERDLVIKAKSQMQDADTDNACANLDKVLEKVRG